MSSTYNSSDTSIRTFYDRGSEEYEESEENIFKADYEDVEALEAMVDDKTELLFNTTTVFEKVHMCSVSHTIKDRAGRIVAAIFLADYPNVMSIPSDDWVNWINRTYGIRDTNSFNTFWVHLVLYEESCAQTFISALMQYIFQHHDRKNYVLFMVPPNCGQYLDWLNPISTKILPIGCSDEDCVQTLRLLVRQDFVKSYKVRRAVEEDNDDLVPLINAHSHLLVENYGSFYIAEIITRHPDAGRQIIVAEYKGLAVSVLCLNQNVNYEELNKAFDLTVFMGLCKGEDLLPPVVRNSISTTSVPDRDLNICISAMQFPDDNLSTSSSGSLTEISSEYSESHLTFKDISEISIDISFNDFAQSEVMAVQQSSKTSAVEDDQQDSPLDDAEEDEFNFVFGDPNAFVIEIAASAPVHEYSLGLLLEAAFECYPDRDYCIITLPSHVKYFPLLEFFIRVSPKNDAYHPHELYITHKCMLNIVSVKTAREHDSEIIRKFLDTIRFPGNIYRKFVNSLEEPDSNLTTYLLISGNNTKEPIGVVMVNDIEDLDWIKQKYATLKWTDMTKEKNLDVGVIEYYCMSPLFKRHTQFFLREIHRKSGYITLFYGMNRYDSSHNRSRPLPSCLSELLPVPPRKICVSTKTQLKTYEEEPFALYISTGRLISIPKIDINTRIVIVGASYTAIAFLRGLLFSEYRQRLANFNNVTLISIHGMCHSKPPNTIRDMLNAHTSTMDYEYMEKMNFRCNVSIIKGTMTAINRKDKFITVNRKFAVAYDKLFLMCGLQYNVPRKKGVKDYLKVKLPTHMFTINTETEATNALLKIQHICSLHKTSKYNFVVYGFTLDCYCCIAALLKFGVLPQFISLIEPYPPERDGELHHDFIFQDGDVYETVMNTIERLGINLYTGYHLIDWSVDEQENITLKLESHLRYLEMEAVGVFVYPEKSVNKEAFKAIYEAGLVFDGRLVITPDCKTNDPHIYAAGPLTKYSRRFYADNLCHKFFNSEEIGEILGNKIRAHMLPYTENIKLHEHALVAQCFKSGNSTSLAPVYEKPLITYCKLPGEMFYLHVCKPGVTVPLETAMSDDDYGSVLATGDCRNLQQQGYFRIHLNTFNLVETITCLSLTPFDYKKLILLWGKHEALLNNLVKRFEIIYITDLFQYFEKPWCSAIFHDDFPLFENEMMKILMARSDIEGTSPIEDMLNIFQNNGYKMMTEEEYKTILHKFKDSPYELMLQQKLLDFIAANPVSLDMYAHPVLVSYILAGFEESPLFQRL